MLGFIRGGRWRGLLVPVLTILVLGLVLVGWRGMRPSSTQLTLLAEESGRLPWFARGGALFAKATERWGRLESADFSAGIPRPEPPPGYTASNDGGRLIFAHVADGPFRWGDGTQRFMQTTLNLVNDSFTHDVSGTLSFYKSDGSPMTLTVDGVTASQFPVEVPAFSSKRLATEGVGELQSGWAEIRSDQDLAGASSFSTRNHAGTLFSDVGVEESVLSREFTVFADSKGAANTGIALVNPSGDRWIEVDIELRRADGTSVAGSRHSRTMPPRGHTAMFLGELFEDVPGVDLNDFEGSVVIRSEHPLAGITLRTVGALLTSVPMVTPPNPLDHRRRLAFPQIADGAGGGIRIVTTVILFNNTESRVAGELKFVRSDGEPMEVRIGDETDSSFPFDLSPGAVARFLTEGAGAVKTGWADVVMDGPAAGAAIYHILDGRGEALTEVGVPAATRFGDVNLIADSPGAYRTAVALANREERGADVALRLYSAEGAEEASHTVVLPPLNHQALFLDELFADVPGIANWRGWVAVEPERVAGEGFATEPLEVSVLTLRQAGVLTTSTPTVLPVRGFEPVSVFEPAQRLTNSSPAFRWRFGQLLWELAWDRLEVSAPGLGLRAGGIQPGEVLGFGHFLLSSYFAAGLIAELVCTGTDPITFDLLLHGDSPTVAMSGRLEGEESSGLKMVLGPAGAPPRFWHEIAGMELDLTLMDGLIRTPAAAGTVEVESRVWSVSTKLEGEEVRIERTCRHPLTFQAPAPGAPFLESSRPIFLSPGGRLVLRGGGFGGQPAAVFASWDDEREDSFPEVLSESEMAAFAPGEAVGGEVTVRDGQAVGNALLVRSLFAPVVEVRALDASPAGAFSVEMDWAQAGRELGPEEFEIRLFNVGWPAVPGGKGAVLGRMVFRGGAWSDFAEEYEEEREVVLESSTAELLKLTVGNDPIEVRPVHWEGEVSGVVLAYAPLGGQSFVNGHPLEIELSLPGLVFPPRSADEWPMWTVEARSLSGDLKATQAIRGLR